MNGMSPKPIVGAADISGYPREPPSAVGLAVPKPPSAESAVGGAVSTSFHPGVGDHVS